MEQSHSRDASLAQARVDEFLVDAILFDLDGTLIDSTIATERAWNTWGARMGLPNYRHTAHGLTAQSLVSELVPSSRHAEAMRLITRLEVEDVEGIHIKDGVRALLGALPANSWTIVTSCTDELAAARMGAAGLPAPELMVTASHVSKGKPDPEGFLLGARRLGIDIDRCLVVEDAPAGLRAGHTAGAYTLGVAGTYDPCLLEADAVVESLQQVGVEILSTGKLRVCITR